jgi:NADPH2:quinone reductase
MKAIRVHQFGAPSVLEVQTVEDPMPGPNEVLVRVEAAGVNPVDTYIRSGQYGRLPELPFTPGFDGAGRVEAVGPDVTRFAPDDRVYLTGSRTGTAAELAIAAEAQVHALPGNVTGEQGAAIGIPYVTAYRALFQLAEAEAGETVLVHGASGGVGLAAVQLAADAGLTVVGTAGSEEGRKLVAEQGAVHVLDHGAEGYLEEVKALNGGEGVNVVLEMLANQNLSGDLQVLAPFGRVIIIGSRGAVEIDPRHLMLGDATVRGMLVFNASDEELNRIHEQLFSLLSEGRISPVVGRRFPLEEAPEAHRVQMEEPALGKIILLP